MSLSTPFKSTQPAIEAGAASLSLKKPPIVVSPPPSRATTNDNISQGNQLKIGHTFWKRFEDGLYYKGKIIDGPEDILDNKNIGAMVQAYRVKYEDDDDEEDLTEDEILECCVERPVSIGYSFWKRFEDDDFYKGEIIGGPNRVKDKSSGKMVKAFRIKYEDEEEEDLTEEEILALPVENPRWKGRSAKKARLDAGPASREEARTSLLWLPGNTEEAVDAALDKIGPPYGMQAVMNEIQSSRDAEISYKNKERFNPYIGMKIRKNVNGNQYLGEVTTDGRFLETDDGKIRMWEVTYEEGGTDDLDWYQLLEVRADRPTKNHPCRGRQLGSLELFSGCCMISQEFAERRWRIRSVDTSPASNASDRVDVMKFELKDIGFVPDFVWASPPCFTYSLLAGGRHRNVKDGLYEKTEEALEHNHIFARMAKILHEAKAVNPHLIVVIENPRALLAHMPLMKELERSMGLYRTTVDYCAFGRFDKKPTDLWTNDYGLHSTLSEFRCNRKCPYKDSAHPVSSRGHGNIFNAAAIPHALAEEVAEYVNAKFVLDRIRYTKEPTIPQEVDETNTVTSSEGTAAP